MEASTSIKEMLAGNKILVPNYQRAYSWETPYENGPSKTHTDVFLSDIEEYIKSKAKTPYYFGHFLYEERPDKIYAIIDGQQRLTTIIIFLSALYARLKNCRDLTEEEEEHFEDMVKRNSNYRFSTVEYDNQFFRDYVIDRTSKNKNGLDTESAKRIVKAFDYFTKQLEGKDDVYLSQLLNAISSASCTTHQVKNESEAIQMFIFQNNRGKKPSNLEIIKAQFMFNVHLYGGDEKDDLIKEIKTRFEEIYKAISRIEYKIDEDDVLTYTLRVHFNSLWESNAIDKINKLLNEGNPIDFIKSFSQDLANSFNYLSSFFGKDEKKYIEIHSLVSLGGIALALPFIIKAYTFNIHIDDVRLLCDSLESLILRHRLIGTRADMTSRVNDVYQKFTSENSDIQPIIERINWIKNAKEWWWSYWNKSELEKSIQGWIKPAIAKFLLWKYENHLEKNGKNGYAITRFDNINNPELEHIAPQTPTNNEPVAAGYCDYDDEFKTQYIDCLGNYLLLSKSHNCSVGNKPFNEKRDSYNHLAQQREIQEMTKNSQIWDKDKIMNRKNKIMNFVLENL